jgi:hypothetical protein
VIAYAFWHSPAAGVPEAEYEAALAAFVDHLAGAGIPGLRRCRSAKFDELPWIPKRPGYQDWYELDDSAALDALETGAVRAAMEATHAAIARLSGAGSGGLFAARSESSGDSVDPPVAEPGARVRIAWVDKPASSAYGPFIAGLSAAVEPAGQVWQRRLSLGPAREFCLWLPGDGPSRGRN